MQTAADSKNILAQIIEKRRESVQHRKRVLPEVALKIAAEKKAPAVKDFPGALARAGVNVIAEMKKASPSKGLLRENYQPAALAPALEASGAAAISVLTEEDFFLGSLADLKEARKAVQIPILRKDFIIDPWQIWETRAAGADAFLLIVAALAEEDLRELLALGRKLGMEALVEVHSREELHRALSAGAKIVGVNNRDLRTFEIRLETSLELADEIPDDCVAVSESGIHTRAEIERLRSAGYDAFLIGRHLMTMPEPAAGLKVLLGK